MTFAADESYAAGRRSEYKQDCEEMSSSDVLYFFHIWLDAVESAQWNLDEISQIRSICKLFNDYCKRFLSKRKISKLLMSSFLLILNKLKSHFLHYHNQQQKL